MIFKTMLHIQHDQGSQDLDPGLQEKSMNPFYISVGKACIEVFYFLSMARNNLTYYGFRIGIQYQTDQIWLQDRDDEDPSWPPNSLTVGLEIPTAQPGQFEFMVSI